MRTANKKNCKKKPAKSSYPNTQQEIRQQWVEPDNYIPSKRFVLRQHLKQILNLISDLKSPSDLNKVKQTVFMKIKITKLYFKTFIFINFV